MACLKTILNLYNNPQYKIYMNKIVIGGVVYNAVEDVERDCPNCCALFDSCLTSGATPCRLYGDNFHFEYDLLTAK